MRAMRNARTWRCWLAVGGVLACLLAAPFSPAQDVSTRVEQVLAGSQGHGPSIDDLFQLGSPAVPVLIDRLNTYPFPMVIVAALARIGDQRATMPLITFLNRLEPFNHDEQEHQAERITVLAALRDLNDIRAEATLRLLLADEQVQLTTRLAAASALARWGSPPTRQEASALIMETARNWRPETTTRADVLDDALASVRTDESRAVLIERLRAAPLPAEQGRIIHLLAGDPVPAIVPALLAFSEHKDRGAHIRLQAAKVLVGSGLEFPRDRLLVAVQQMTNVLPPDLRAEAEEICRRIGR